ncbi:MAG TPA: PQQ-dependent dehydrogenase, methanol/ethanol family [Blastocatellia bacterium]|nr:PQQ-dependent dehydrogenase, methanol/ethanol family [Blastocatellia bacterium]
MKKERIRDGEIKGRRDGATQRRGKFITLCLFVPLSLLLSISFAQAQVGCDRIRHAETEPQNWLTYSGNYQSHRYSPLSQINTTNVAQLKPVWVYQMRDPGKVEATPLVVDGVIYLSEKPHVVTALDGRTGRPLWTYRRTTPSDARGCCGIPNRGLAVLGETLYLTTFDSHLVALDIHTGKPRWDVIVADYKLGYTMTAAPLAIKNQIIVGIGGGEYGIRGFLDAYDAKTGKRLWRFWTVPAAGEAGNETWSGDSWKTGGAPTWVTGSYDPELNLIYWTTGNPAPDWNGDARLGDNLYSDCLLAIEADTGKLRWHFQFTPHDVWDWDANQVPVLFDAIVNGKPRKLVAQANRNAFYYLLDRTTGEFLRGAPYIKQTWASGLDAKGRPIKLPNIEPSTTGALVYPGLGGATNWYSPSYSPQTKLFYVLARENHPQYFFKADATYHAGDLFEGGGGRDLPGVEPYGTVKALDALTGKQRWEFRLFAPAMTGLMATAGGLVFGGSSEGYFYALDARTGKVLWKFMAGYQIVNNPISYAIRGKQYVATIAGQGLFVFSR